MDLKLGCLFSACSMLKHQIFSISISFSVLKFWNPASLQFFEQTNRCIAFNIKINSYNLNVGGWGKGIEDIVGNDAGYQHE